MWRRDGAQLSTSLQQRYWQTSAECGTATDPPTTPQTLLCKPSAPCIALIVFRSFPAERPRSTGAASGMPFPLSCNAVLTTGSSDSPSGLSRKHTAGQSHHVHQPLQQDLVRLLIQHGVGWLTALTQCVRAGAPVTLWSAPSTMPGCKPDSAWRIMGSNLEMY